MEELSYPQNIQDIFGHSKTLSVLEKFIERDKIPGSLLFYGPQGVGKTSTAFYFTKILFSKDIENQDSEQSKPEEMLFGDLPEVKEESNKPFIDAEIDRKISQLIHPDILYITKKEDKKNIEIEEIRKISEFLSKSSSQSKYKVVIIDKIDDLTINSANSLLKILEEPNDKSIIIAISDNIDSVLQTILSRCVKLYFPYLNKNDLSDSLRDKIIYNKENEISFGDLKKYQSKDFTDLNNKIDKFIDSKTIYNITDLSKLIKKDPENWDIFKKLIFDKINSKNISKISTLFIFVSRESFLEISPLSMSECLLI